MKKLTAILCGAVVGASAFISFCTNPAIITFAEEPETVQEVVQEEPQPPDATVGEIPEETETTPTEPENQPEIEPTTPETETNEEDSETNLEEVAGQFVSYLKDKYGADYPYYYNQIIDQWGTIEAYLLQFGEEHLTEEQQTGWNKFVGWLSDYSVIWAPILAIAITIIVGIVGKKKFEETLQKAVVAKTNPIVEELNKQSAALAALSQGTKALLPNTEKFEQTAETLDNSAKELTNG